MKYNEIDMYWKRIIYCLRAMHLIEHSKFLRDKNIKITWMPQEYGNIQRGLQSIKELLYNTDKGKLDCIGKTNRAVKLNLRGYENGV